VGRNPIALLGAVALCGFLSATAQAQVVALGASNTAGKGVAPQEAYPVQLEAMLRAKGYNGHVVNAGLNGDTTTGMLARLDSAVPKGTRVVILQPGGNDFVRRRGSFGGGSEARAENIEQIVSRLRSRGVQVIMLENQTLGAVPAQYHQPDGQHLTPEGLSPAGLLVFYRRLRPRSGPSEPVEALSSPKPRVERDTSGQGSCCET
jgi:acyl-CoA thioesterase I